MVFIGKHYGMAKVGEITIRKARSLLENSYCDVITGPKYFKNLGFREYTAKSLYKGFREKFGPGLSSKDAIEHIDWLLENHEKIEKFDGANLGEFARKKWGFEWQHYTHIIRKYEDIAKFIKRGKTLGTPYVIIDEENFQKEFEKKPEFKKTYEMVQKSRNVRTTRRDVPTEELIYVGSLDEPQLFEYMTLVNDKGKLKRIITVNSPCKIKSMLETKEFLERENRDKKWYKNYFLYLLGAAEGVGVEIEGKIVYTNPARDFFSEKDIKDIHTHVGENLRNRNPKKFVGELIENMKSHISQKNRKLFESYKNRIDFGVSSEEEPREERVPDDVPTHGEVESIGQIFGV